MNFNKIFLRLILNKYFMHVWSAFYFHIIGNDILSASLSGWTEMTLQHGYDIIASLLDSSYTKARGVVRRRPGSMGFNIIWE